MNSLTTATFDTAFLNPATWPDYSRELRVAWIEEQEFASDTPPAKLGVLSHLPNINVVTLSWNQAITSSELAQFFDQIEVLIILSEYNSDKSILSYAALMGRAVITDDKSQSLINHGETGLVIKSDPQIIAEGILLLRDSPQLRGALGRNLRQKYLSQFEGITRPCAE